MDTTVPSIHHFMTPHSGTNGTNKGNMDRNYTARKADRNMREENKRDNIWRGEKKLRDVLATFENQKEKKERLSYSSSLCTPVFGEFHFTAKDVLSVTITVHFKKWEM